MFKFVLAIVFVALAAAQVEDGLTEQQRLQIANTARLQPVKPKIVTYTSVDKPIYPCSVHLYTKSTGGLVNVRSLGTSGSPIVGQIASGEMVEVDQYSTNWFHFIRAQDMNEIGEDIKVQPGWIHRSQLVFSTEEAGMMVPLKLLGERKIGSTLVETAFEKEAARTSVFSGLKPLECHDRFVKVGTGFDKFWLDSYQHEYRP
jgi:hypothetical protein